MDIREIIEDTNIAEKLDDELLNKIGRAVVDGFNIDLDSREEWEKNTKLYIKLALQVKETKNWPWQDASNVKFPLLSIASMQFAARAYPSLVPSNGEIVTCKVIGSDPDGSKTDRAKRIGTHMSYQLMDQMEGWEEDMDRLLVILPILGVAFKKSYYDNQKGQNVSCLVHPQDLVVNYWAKSLEDAERKTQIYNYTEREIKERKLAKLYLDVDLGDPVLTDFSTHKDSQKTKFIPSQEDSSTPYPILEQHTYWDLDNDGYPEPYVITVEYTSRKVLRIVARYTAEGIHLDEDQNIIKVDPIEYYTKFGCIPNPDGSFYDIGFGHLLHSINSSVNTILNQLIDSGTLHNLQSGFIGKGLRISMKDSKFSPGEWKAVNATADDIKKQIFPLPTKEPSSVLFQLLGMLVQSAKELASVSEIFVGKLPGQNTPAYTTKETVDQGMKLFTAVYKRIYKSLTKEFRKLYLLNRIYLDPQEEISVLDEPIQQSDYAAPEDDIIPAADPMATSQTSKEAKAQQLLQLMSLGTLNPMEVTQRILIAMEQPNPEKLINQQPQQSPEQQKAQTEMQTMQMAAQIKQQESGQKMQLDAFKAQLEAQSKQMDMKLEAQSQQMNMYFEQMKAIISLQSQQQQSQLKAKQTVQQLQQNDLQHTQKMQQQDEIHQANLKNAKKTNTKENRTP